MPYLKPGADPGDAPAVERPSAQSHTGVDSSVPGLDYRRLLSKLTARSTGIGVALRSAEIGVWELLAARYPQPARLDDLARGGGHRLMGVNAMSATLREIAWPGGLVIDMTRATAQLVPPA